MSVGIRKFLHNIFRLDLRGDGNLYVLGIIGAIMAGSYFVTGGLTPNIEKVPDNPEIVQIDPNKISSDQDSLQLINLVPLSPSPTPTPTPTLTPTKTPTVTLTPTRTPVPTEPVQVCYNKTLVNLLLDYSNSMSSRQDSLTRAMTAFYNSLKKYPTAAIGAQAFAGRDAASANGYKGVYNILDYKFVKDLTASDITKISKANSTIIANSYGTGTYMRNGFSVAVSKLNASKSNSAYNGYKRVTIVFSDGIPEETWTDRESHGDPNSSTVCLGSDRYNDRCFALYQDPRSWNGRSDLTASMKSATDSVYVVGIFGNISGERVFMDELTTLLKKISESSSKPYYQFFDLRTDSVENLTPAFETIFADICS